MSITINDIKFNEMPLYCGICPAYLAGQMDKSGFCVFFEKKKYKYNNIPVRCKTLFLKGFKLGGELVIVIK
jgi:hypothetical protein